jgi:tetratricopeptide (TPR) repeat protein
MTRPARLVLPGLVALFLAHGSVARAEPKPGANAEQGAETPEQKRARALGLFDKSVMLYDSGRFAEAAALLEEAYATFPEPVLLYNLARAYQESGELAKSIDAYERFLAADPGVRDRGGIEQRIVTLREQLRAAERAKADAATPQPPTKPIETKAAVAPASASAPHDQGASHGASLVPWIVAGVGAVALGTGAVLGVVANSRHESAKDDPSATKAESLQRQADDARRERDARRGRRARPRRRDLGRHRPHVEPGRGERGHPDEARRRPGLGPLQPGFLADESFEVAA